MSRYTTHPDNETYGINDADVNDVGDGDVAILVGQLSADVRA